MPTLLGRPYSIQELRTLWAPTYEAVLDILGSTGTILPIGDPFHGQPNATTFKTVGEEQVTWTWSEAPSAWDTPLDLTNPDSYRGIIPQLTFNGTDEEADTPDATYWSRGDGSNDSPFSIGLWVNLTDATSNTLLSKWENTGSALEWSYLLEASDLLVMQFRDTAGTPATVSRTSDSAIGQGVWRFLVMTYDGAGGSSAMDTVVLYNNGVVEASTASNSANYTAMNNKTNVVELGREDGTSNLLDGKMAGGPLGPFFTQAELSADAILRLYQLGRVELGV